MSDAQLFDGWAETAKTMGIAELLTAPRSPWQNAYVEWFIGSARRECLDHARPTDSATAKPAAIRTRFDMRTSCSVLLP